MNTKEELGKLLFDATTAISALMANVEFGKNSRNLPKANKFRQWLIYMQNQLVNDDTQTMVK